MNKSIRKAIQNMQGNGCQVHLNHIRRVVVNAETQERTYKPRGGMTRISLFLQPEIIPEMQLDKALEVSGEARCSNRDVYCRDTGANRAFASLMKNLHSVVGRAKILKIVATPPAA